MATPRINVEYLQRTLTFNRLPKEKMVTMRTTTLKILIKILSQKKTRTTQSMSVRAKKIQKKQHERLLSPKLIVLF